MDWDPGIGCLRYQCEELAECAVWEERQAMGLLRLLSSFPQERPHLVRQAELESDLDREDDGGYEDDGQPSEYEEWQDFYGGDDWDHGQYDSCEEW